MARERWTELDPRVAEELDVPARVEDTVLARKVAEIMQTPRLPSRPESIRFLVACARAAEDMVHWGQATGDPLRDFSAEGGDAVYSPAAGELSPRERVICGIDLGVLSADPRDLSDEAIQELRLEFMEAMWDRAATLAGAVIDLLPEDWA